MKKILIISHFVPPVDSAGSVRIYKIAKELSKLGHEIKILTSKKYSFDSKNTFIRNMEHIEVIEVPYAPFEKLKKFQKTKEESAFQKNEKKNVSKQNSLISVLKSVKQQFGTLIDIYNFWITPAYKKALEINDRWKYDIIISSYSPAASHKIASRLKNKFSHLYWVADYRDLWSGNYTRSLPRLISKVERLVEYKTVKNADLIITVSDPLKEKLTELFSKKHIQVLYNGYDKLTERVQIKKQNNLIKIVYTGGIYEKQSPRLLFDTIAALDESKKKLFCVEFYGYVNKDAMVLIEANDFVHYCGIVSRDEALMVQQNADILLMLEWNDYKQQGVVTSKLFDYLETQIPILSVGDYRNESANIIEKVGIGKYCSNIKEVQDFLFCFQNYKSNLKKLKNYSMNTQIEQLELNFKGK